MKRLNSWMQVLAWIAVSTLCFNCSESDPVTDDPDTTEEQTPGTPGGETPEEKPSTPGEDEPVVPEPPKGPNAVLAGQWSKRATMGLWVIDPEGNVKVLNKNYVFPVGLIVYNRDSSYVELLEAYKFDYNPDARTMTIADASTGTTAEAKDVLVEENRFTYVDAATEETGVFRRMGDYCSVAPASIEGLYMSALRYKAHGMRYAANGKAYQYFFYDEVVDNLISSYTYKRGVGNKAHLAYHVKYRLNPQKTIDFTGEVRNYSDVTFDIQGELDLDFYTHVVDEKSGEEYYLGEMDGQATITTLNNKTNVASMSVITGRKYFSLTSVPKE